MADNTNNHPLDKQVSNEGQNLGDRGAQNAVQLGNKDYADQLTALLKSDIPNSNTGMEALLGSVKFTEVEPASSNIASGDTQGLQHNSGRADSSEQLRDTHKDATRDMPQHKPGEIVHNKDGSTVHYDGGNPPLPDKITYKDGSYATFGYSKDREVARVERHHKDGSLEESYQKVKISNDGGKTYTDGWEKQQADSNGHIGKPTLVVGVDISVNDNGQCDIFWTSSDGTNSQVNHDRWATNGVDEHTVGSTETDS